MNRARKDYEQNIAKQIKQNPKKNWQYIKNKINIKTGIADLLKDPSNPTSEVATSRQG